MVISISTTSANAVPRRRTHYYDGLCAHLRNRVLAGQTGDRLPGDRDLAKEIGTSKITVGHILQELQAEGLVERIPGKGTFLKDRNRPRHLSMPPAGLATAGAPANHHASGPAPIESVSTASSSQPFVMILAVLNLPWSRRPNEENYTYRATMGVEQCLQRAGARTMVRNRHGVEEEDIENVIDYALRAGVDRILYVSASLPQPERMALFENHVLKLAYRTNVKPIPVVQIAFRHNEALPVDGVLFDGEFGSQTVTEHLIELGHSNIVFVAMSAESKEETRDWVTERVRGFLRALQLSGIEPPMRLDEPSVVRATNRLFQADSMPDGADNWAGVARRIAADRSITAIVAANDETALALINELAKLGIRAPDDISIVGFDNLLAGATMDLTTVQIPIEQMCEAACELMLRPEIETPQRTTQIVVRPSLVVRGSAKPMRA